MILIPVVDKIAKWIGILLLVAIADILYFQVGIADAIISFLLDFIGKPLANALLDQLNPV